MHHTFYCRIHTSILHYTVVSCDCHPNWSTTDSTVSLLSWSAHIHAREVQCMATFTQNTCFVCGYIWVLGLILLISLLQFPGWWLAWISSRAWHLPSRNLISSFSSVTHCVTALISHCFLVTSSTCSIDIWDNNTSCKGMLKSNALKAFKLLWNWVINALKVYGWFFIVHWQWQYWLHMSSSYEMLIVIPNT